MAHARQVVPATLAGMMGPVATVPNPDMNGAPMNAHQKSYPIVEALVEFQFDPASPWDMTIPGLLFKELDTQFPHREQKRLINQRVEMVAEGPRQTVNIIERMQMFSEDRLSLVQVNQHLLTVNRLAPYTKWEAFLPSIKTALTAYVKIAKPIGLRRVGLRFINKIRIPGQTIKMEQYFRFYPHLEAGLPQDFASFACSVVIPFAELGGFLNLQLRADPEHPEVPSTILDLDLFSESVTLDQAIEWVDKAHTELDVVFNAAITGKTRALLGWEA